MSYRCVIVDDERPARERVKRLLAEHADFELIGEAAGADAAVELIDRIGPDLCFLDVRMPQGDGFDVLRRVRRIPTVIFTTAYDEYAVQAFEVKSLDYLLKPFSRGRFGEALERARQALVGRNETPDRIVELLDEIRDGAAGRAAAAPQRISARRGARIVLLDPGDVLWFEAEETLVFARTSDGRFLVERTLGELENDLAGRFFRSHRGHLVNLARIREILPGDAGTYRIVVLGVDDADVPLSRRQARKLRELIPW